MRRLLLPLIFGLAGAVVLVGLGVWQLQRLTWKTAILTDIDARIVAAPVALPERPDATRDRYLPMTVAGRFTGEEADILTSGKFQGVGYRVIAVLETEEGRRILIDRGFLPEDQRDAPRPPKDISITGNLHWPDEMDSFTPPPDRATGIWFARDVPLLAAELNTEPTLIVAREPTGDGIAPMPVDSSSIANDHFNYAMTWFSLAFVWLGMTGFWLLRIRRRMA
jgi:surfeit locus 1 family protein